jgi:hypothetical protein
MRSPARAFLTGLFVIAGGLGAGASAADAQGIGSRGSLGGYGAGTSYSDPGMGTGAGGYIISYAGKFGGFMPYRMGGGGDLSFRSRPTAAMGSARTSFSLAPMPGGMSSMSGGMGRGFGSRTRTSSSFGSRGGMGLGGGMRKQATDAGRMGVMPPSFGYPFRQPPSPVAPSAGPAMSM